MEHLLSLLEEVLGDGWRTGFLDELAEGKSLDDQLKRLRRVMGEHQLGSTPKDFRKAIRKVDNRTRQDGFRVLHSWDHQTHSFSRDTTPALLLDFFVRSEVPAPDPRVTTGILLDYYLLHLLSLCAMRVWDSPDPDELLGRVQGQLERLQGDAGSGHQFVGDAETLIIYALSQFHPEEHAYDRVIERFHGLALEHRVLFAGASAAVLSAHLRWGFWLMYGRDVVRMRDDNVGDYPWLLWSTATLLDEYVAGGDRRARALTALGQALAADPWLFDASAPPALAAYRDEHARVKELLALHGRELVAELDRSRPTKQSYAPLSLHFNFPHNALVAITTLALLESRPQALPLNALFEDEMEGLREGERQEDLARLLMAFSAGSPDRLGHRGAMLVAYDPLSAMRSYSMTRDVLLELAAD